MYFTYRENNQTFQDFGIWQGTQENYASGGYSPGPLSPRHESSVVYFQEMVRTALGA